MRFSRDYKEEPIAIVAAECRLPGGRNVDEFWSSVCAGKVAIDHIPESRFNRELLYDPEVGALNKTYTDLAALSQALGALFGVGISGWSDAASIAVLRSYGVWALCAFALSLPVVPLVSERLPEKLRGALGLVLTLLLFAASLLFLVGQSYNPFIYFRF